MDQSPSREANRFSAHQEIPRILWKPKFHCRIYKSPPPALFWAKSIQSMPPYPSSWGSIIILSFHLYLGLPNGLFLSGFPTITLYTLLLSPIRATCTTHLILLDFIIQRIFGEQYRSWSFSLCSFLHSHVTSSLLGPNVILNTLFSNTLSLRSSLNVSAQVSHPYKTTGKIIVLYIFSFTILDINYLKFILFITPAKFEKS